MSVALLGNIPEAIRKAAWMRGANWSTYIPLKYLTDNFVNSDDARNLKLTNGFLEISVKRWSELKEWQLTQPEVMEALRRLLQLYKVYAPDWHPLWLQIYETNIFGSAPPRDGWEVTREYDELLRRSCFPAGASTPTWDDQHLWETTRLTVANRRDSLHKSSYSDLRTEIDSLRGQLANKGFAPSAASAQPQSSPAKPRTDRSSRGSDPSGNVTNTSTFCCFVCGGVDHIARACQATCQARTGRPILLRKTDSGAWLLNGDTPICYNFNLSKGCAGGCSHGEHQCSLCLSREHGAPACRSA